MKKKNKYLPMLILIAVLALLSVVYIVVLNVNKRSEENSAQEETGSIGEIKIADYDLNEIQHIEYTSDSGTTSLSLSEDNTWHYDEDESFPIDQDKLDGMAGAIASISAKRTVEEGEPSDYGLDEPSLTISVKYSDDSTHVYKIGDVNSFNSQTYFMADDRIYMISDSISAHFDCAVDDLIKISDSLPDDIDNEYVNKIIVRNSDDKSCEISDSAGVEELLSLIKQKINFSMWAEYGIDTDKKSDKYGITDDGDQIVIDYKREETVVNDDGTESAARIDTTYTINLGSLAEDGYRFYSTPNSDMVYKISEDDYNLLMGYVSYEPETETNAES